MNVLAVVAHPDDEILGCGATLKKLADQGHRVFSCVLCAAVEARHNRPSLERLESVSKDASRLVGIADSIGYGFKNIQFNAVPHLEMVKAVEDAIRRFKPQWIFTHHPSDLNIDHRVCYETTMAAVMLPQRLSSDLEPTMISRVFLVEILSSTDWAPPVGDGFRPNSFFDVSATFAAKQSALEAFEGALKPFPHSRSRENVRSLASLRGAQVGFELAEAFSLVRDLNF
jgi:LmbE family N-acetylglucosaminyl deacetylase